MSHCTKNMFTEPQRDEFSVSWIQRVEDGREEVIDYYLFSAQIPCLILPGSTPSLAENLGFRATRKGHTTGLPREAGYSIKSVTTTLLYLDS